MLRCLLALLLTSLSRPCAFLTAALSALLLAVAPAGAGTPIEREVTCPIDGSIFKRIDTRSCTTFAFTMALRRRTSCDFVTVLPVCKSNGFPVYREFSDAELVLLKAHVKTMDFKRLMMRSRFYTAWHVETWLAAQGHGNMTPRRKFNLLILGLARRPHAGLEDAQYRKLILEQSKEGIAAFSAADRPVLEALMAFVEIHDGQKKAATARLKQLDKAAKDSAPLALYIKAVRACLKDDKAATCDPNASIPGK